MLQYIDTLAAAAVTSNLASGGRSISAACSPGGGDADAVTARCKVCKAHLLFLAHFLFILNAFFSRSQNQKSENGGEKFV